MIIHNATLTGSISMQAPPVISGSLTLTGSINATGDITASSARFSNIVTAQTLVVQTVSSSITYSSGSNVFGNLASNTQVFTGSMFVTGSITQTGTNTTASFSGLVGVGTTTPAYTLDVTGTGRFTSYLTAINYYSNNGYSNTNNVGSVTNNPNYNFLGSGAYWGIRTGTAFDFNLDTYNGGSFVNALKIAQSGAATFSSSVTANGNLTINGNRTIYLTNPSTAAGSLVFYNSTSSTIKSGLASYYNVADEGNLEFLSGGSSTKMILTSGGNVGIGTLTPNVSGQAASVGVLTIKGSTSWGGVEVSNNANTADGLLIGFYGFTNSGLSANYTMPSYIGTWLEGGGVTSGGNLRFHTQTSGTAGAAERMRITSAGDVTIGTTPTANGHNFFMGGGNGAYQSIGHPNGTSTGYSYTLYYYNSGVIGGISQSGTTAVVYNTASDYRLKENVTPIVNAINKIMQIKPVSYKWKNTEDEYGEGFLAHELQQIIPLAVTGEKDALHEDGSFKLQQVDYSKLVPYLVKAIQELNQKFEDYKSTHP